MKDYFAKRVQQRQRIYQNVKRSIIRERRNYYSGESMAVNMRLLKAIIELKHYHQGQQSTCEGRDSNLRGIIRPGSPPMSYVACGLDFSSSPAGQVEVHARGRIIKTQCFIPLASSQIGKQQSTVEYH